MPTLVKVGRAEELKPGQKTLAEIDGLALVIANVDGKFCAVEDVCTHDGGPLGEGELDGCELICPRHGARFDVCTGAATRMPAFENIGSYTVRVCDGDLLVEA
jgi:3-phenylpropionate/trans-cinnamate dioxygenase ferredoxin subunit